MRATSRAAYDHIVNTGILGKRRTQVYIVLWHYGPLSSRDTWEHIHKRYPSIPQHSINPRMVELMEDLGVVKEVGETTCRHTGRRVMLFDVTDHIPRHRYHRRKRTTKLVLAENEACARIAEHWSNQAAVEIRQRHERRII